MLDNFTELNQIYLYIIFSVLRKSHPQIFFNNKVYQLDLGLLE